MVAIEGDLKIRCPKCNSNNLDWHKVENEYEEHYVLKCKDCGKVFADYELEDQDEDKD